MRRAWLRLSSGRYVERWMLLQVIVSGWCSRGFPMRPEFYFRFSQLRECMGGQGQWCASSAAARKDYFRALARRCGPSIACSHGMLEMLVSEVDVIQYPVLH
jgi:hypothetical protein